jgi:hypothetical protein
MNIGQFAKKPELIKVELTDAELVASYGSVITFWIYDTVDINTYFDFFKSQNDKDGARLNELMRSLIRNEAGELAIPEGNILPIDLSIASLTAINERLGKSATKPSTQTTGEQPS